jgi:hypothetical protein
MSEIAPASYREALENYFGSEGGVEDLSDTEVQELFEKLLAEGEAAMEAQLEDQFDKNFQTMSYLFMKEIYTHAEEETSRL